MKKTLYGLYVLWLGILVKTIKRKNIPFQMKFLQAAMKFSSMVLIITTLSVLSIACTVPGGSGPSIPIINPEPKEEIIRGNWKAGLITQEPEVVIKPEAEEATETPSKDNVVVKGTLEPQEEVIKIIEVIIPNFSFEEPGLSEPSKVVTGEQLSGWTINKGDVTLIGNVPKWFPPPEGAQAVALNGKGPAEIVQNIKTILGREYKLEFFALAGASCTPEEAKLAVIWNDEERVVVNLNISQWGLYEVNLESQMVDNSLGFQTKSTSGCGSGIDNVKLLYEDDGKINTTKVDATDSIESLKLELQKLLQDLRNDPLSAPEVPTSTPTIVPSVESEEPTPTPISQFPTPTPTPQPDVTITPSPTDVPVPTITPEATVVVTVTPEPTSKYDIPQQATKTTAGNIINFSGNPKLVGDIISFSGNVLTKEEPLAVQVWNLQGTDEAKVSDAKYDSNVCSTEKPSIFFREPPELGYAYIENSVIVNWTYCLNTYNIPNESTVPWELATKWEFKTSTGLFTFEGNKLGGTTNEYSEVNKYVIVVIGPQGVMARREVN